MTINQFYVAIIQYIIVLQKKFLLIYYLFVENPPHKDLIYRVFQGLFLSKKYLAQYLLNTSKQDSKALYRLSDRKQAFA